jgi:hypothetical protein
MLYFMPPADIHAASHLISVPLGQLKSLLLILNTIRILYRQPQMNLKKKEAAEKISSPGVLFNFSVPIYIFLSICITTSLEWSAARSAMFS